MMVCFLAGLQACVKDNPTIIGENLNFKAVNLSANGNGQLSANSGGTVITSDINITVNIDGEITNINVVCKSNELPVQSGDEIEITFYPSCKEETEALISLPDGSSRRVTAASPTFRWYVPESFSEPKEIIGKSNYETESGDYIESGMIKLIPIIR